MHRIRHLPLISLMLLASLGLVACGSDGGGDSDADPQQVLDQTFKNDQTIESGAFDLSLKINAEGDQGGNIEASLGGPFQGGGDKFPSFDVTADLSADTPQGDFSFDGGLSSTGDKAFVNYQDTDYEVPQELFDQFTATYEQLQQQSAQQSNKSSSFLESLGINPSNWLTDLQNDGTEDVDGVETIHISGQADVPKLLDDVQQIAQKAGPAAQQLSPAELGAVEDSVKSAEFNVYSGADDNLLRRLSGTLEVEPPASAAGAPSNVSIEFDLSFSDVNDPQTISAPENPEPLSTLLESNPILQGILSGATGGSPQGGLGGLPQSGGSTAPPSNSTSQAYLECLQTAQGQDALQKCAELLQ